MEYIIGAVLGLVVGGVIFFPLGIRYRKNVSEKEISSAEEEGKRIINEAIKSAETKKNLAERTSSGRKTVCSRRKRTWTARRKPSRRRRSPWPRSTRLWTRRTRRSRSSSAARPRCWSASPALPPRRPSST